MNSLQYQSEQLSSIHHAIGLFAVIAVAAFLLVVFFAKVVQQQFPAADWAFGIRLCFKEEQVVYFLFHDGFALLEFAQTFYVFWGIEADTLSFTAIATCATCFLVVSFQRFGYVVVYDKSYIGFIDTHTKGDGSYNHLHFLHEERILVLAACSGVHACVIGQGRDVVGVQRSGQVFHGLAAQAVDDTRLVAH